MFLTTALYAALAALIILALAANVVRLRLRHGVSLGDGGRGEGVGGRNRGRRGSRGGRGQGNGG